MQVKLSPQDMTVEFTDQHGQLLDTQQIAKECPDESQYRKSDYKIIKPYWTSSVCNIKTGNNHISIHEVEVTKRVKVKTVNGPATVGMIFIEDGQISVRQTDNSFRKIGNLQHNIVYNSNQTEETIFEDGQRLRLTTIDISPQYFLSLAGGGSDFVDKIAGDIITKNGHRFATDDNLPITHSISALLNSLSHEGYNSATSRLSTEAKILELLSQQLTQSATQSQDKSLARLSDSDIIKLKIAKDFLLTDISQSPSLSEISLHAGINTFKLKTGFKALFGFSVFAYLREQRLEFAYREVIKRKHSLTEIAYSAGFASISHFSDAFKQRFGVSPGQIR